MNWVDGVIILALVTSVFSGYRRGVILQVFSWGGFIAGLFIGGIVALRVTNAVAPETRLSGMAISLASFLGTAFIIEGLVAFAGFKIARKLSLGKVRAVDAVAGSVVAAVVTILVGWILSPVGKEVPEVAASLRDSAILRGTHATLGVPPDIFSAVGRFLDQTGFPEVFAELNPSLAPGVEPPPRRLARDPEIRAAARLTYKIDGSGCGGRVTGSGFPVNGNTVITAAHVVAGTSGTQVIQATDAGGSRFDARVVYMDDATDIAVLRVPGLTGGALGVGTAQAERGTDGAAIGYPGGGDRVSSPARVRARTNAIGRDIYGRGDVRREIYVMRAEVIQGNSGGPFVDTDGVVRGMVFAASASDPDESYALAETEIREALANAGDRNRAVDTGDCAL